MLADNACKEVVCRRWEAARMRVNIRALTHAESEEAVWSCDLAFFVEEPLWSELSRLVPVSRVHVHRVGVDEELCVLGYSVPVQCRRLCCVVKGHDGSCEQNERFFKIFKYVAQSPL